ALALLRPEPHRHGRHEEEVQPRMEVEERLQVGLAALVEVAEVERERAGQDQEDHDEDVGDRRREVAAQLALEDRDDAAHVRASLPVAPCVTVRNTSSSRPPSSASSRTATPCAFSASLTATKMARPGFGNAVMRLSCGSTSIAATSATRAKASFAAETFSAVSETAW